MGDIDDSDEDYDFVADPHNQDTVLDKRYPLHDCCEFEDGVEKLKELIYASSDGESENDEDDETNDQPEDEEQEAQRHTKHDDDSSSSSDENDSTAAAHAAAIGHSPQPLKTNLLGTSAMPLHDGISLKMSDSPNGMNEKLMSVANVTLMSETSKNESAKEVNENVNLDTSAAKQPEESLTTLEDCRAKLHEPNVESANEDPTTLVPPESLSQDTMAIDDEKDTDVQKVLEPEKQYDDSNAASVKHVSNKPLPKRSRRRRIHTAANLNERDDDENTPLHIAIHARKLEHVRVLLEAGCSFRTKCDGSLPVHTAISLGAIRAHRQFAYDCMVLLHEHGADLTAKDDSIHTPLYLACMYNLPQNASYILSDADGLTTLNTRADRAGNRPLHAAAKFDTLENPSFSKVAAASATGNLRIVRHHHPDGSVVSSMHPIPRSSGKLENITPCATVTASEDSAGLPSPEALLTQVFLNTPGIEIDATNVMGQTPLHVACMRGNWAVARLLIQADADPTLKDRRGYTPGQLAYKRAMPIPNDLVDILGDPPTKGIIPQLRDLIVDPNGSTFLVTHELCILHRTCPPIRRDSPEPPPENVRRLHVLLDKETGIFRTGEFSSLSWNSECRRAALSDVLKVHDFSYVERLSQMTSSIPDHPNAVAHLDADTAVSRWSFEAALRAAGAICQAVDKVVAGECRNSFCAVRPPGHHAGPRGIVKCANDIDGGSHGFCLLNNVCIGAAYARSMYRHEGIRKVAIVDFDVHHGNGTEAIIRNLVPTTEKGIISTPFAYGDISTTTYRPWLDETDIKNIFFASTHGYGRRGYDQPGWFYPASGKSQTSEAISHPAMVENPSLGDFILSQTWSRMGEESILNCCKIVNIGLPLPDPDADPHARSMKQRLELRDSYRKNILPNLREFDPDLIFISAGFDGHRKDTMNFGYIGMVEDDYEWVTEQIVKVANTCCNGRIVSVLEGGYKMHGGIVSPFARSAGCHVRALVDGGRSRELYDQEECELESQFEKHLYERRERKREQEREQLRLLEEENQRRHFVEKWIPSYDGEAPDDPDAPADAITNSSRKRRRNQVNYKELFKQMQEEGFAG